MFHVSGHLRWGIGGLLEPDGRKTFHAKLCDWGRSWCHPRSWQVRVETELKMVKMVRKIDGFQGIPGNHLKSIWLGIKHGEKSWEILDGFNSMLFMFIPKQIFFPRNSPVIYSWRFFSRYIYELIGNFLKQKPSIFRMRWGVLDLFPPIHWAFSIW